MPDYPALSSPPPVDKAERSIRLYVRLAFGFWYLFGLLPATWAIGQASVRTDFNLNAALGAFGDSFASVTSLMTFATVLAVGYQILRDRELKQSEELLRKHEQHLQTELVMLSTLIQSRQKHNDFLIETLRTKQHLLANTKIIEQRKDLEKSIAELKKIGSSNGKKLQVLIDRAEYHLNLPSTKSDESTNMDFK